MKLEPHNILKTHITNFNTEEEIFLSYYFLSLLLLCYGHYILNVQFRNSVHKETHFEQLSAINGNAFIQDKNYLRQYVHVMTK